MGSSELQDLLTDFSNLDKSKRGLVSLADAIKMLRDQYKLPKWNPKVLQKLILSNETHLSFDEFLALLWEVEREHGKEK